MTIRPETEKDFEEIYKLVKIAFQTAEVSDGKEQDFVIQLRKGENYIPELALVAEENGKLIGHIMLNRQLILDEDNEHAVLLLAPISVVLEQRNKGIGSKLIKESFEQAKEMGYTAVVLVGNPAYYNRFGFKEAAGFGLSYPGIPDQFVMALELVPDALKDIKGIIAKVS